MVLSTNSAYVPIQDQQICLITEMECVYCAVGTEYLITIQVSFHCKTVKEAFFLIHS